MSDEMGKPEMTIASRSGRSRSADRADGTKGALLRAEVARAALLPVLRAISIRLRETSSVRHIGLPPRVTLRAMARELALEVTIPEMALAVRLPASGTIKGEISLDALDLARTVAVGAAKDATVALFATRAGPETRLSVRIGERVTHLAAAPERGPRAPALEGPELTLPGGRLRDALALVAHASARGESATSRPILSSICMTFGEEAIELVAADNYRLARTELAVPVPPSLHDRRIVVAASSIRLLATLLDERVVRLRVGERHLGFNVAHGSLVASTETATYPDYRSIISAEAPAALVRVGSAALRTALGAIVPIAVRDRSKVIRLTVGDGIVLIGADDARSEPVGERAGGTTTVELAIDGTYLVDAAKAAGEAELAIGANGPLVPLELAYAGAREWVMPIKLAS